MLLDKILISAVENKASDIHISVGIEPIARINGKLIKLAQYVICAEDSYNFVQHILNETDRLYLAEVGEIDTTYVIKDLSRFRINIFKQRNTYSIAFRVIATIIPSMEELKLPPVFMKLAEKQRGLILVTGPTGSGKSTTMASMIHYMNTHLNKHIITIEDPIEYLHNHGTCIINQRELGKDTLSFSNALRAALREDPDVILVGEMRDPETISIAITAAETGHLVISTLHTLGAAKTIDRIVDSFPPAQQQQIKVQLATSIEAVISQQILPRADKKERIAAFEIMLATSAIRNLIREGKNYQINSFIQTGSVDQMQTMDHCLLNLHKKGFIDTKTLTRYAIDLAAIENQLG